MERTATDPDRYLADLGEAGTDARALDEMIRECMPGRSRTVWEGTMWGGTEQVIIGYGDLQQPRPKGETVDWFLIGVAKQKGWTSVYVNAVAEGDDGLPAYLVKQYADRLKPATVGSAAIKIRQLDHVDGDVLRALFRRAHAISG